MPETRSTTTVTAETAAKQKDGTILHAMHFEGGTRDFKTSESSLTEQKLGTRCLGERSQLCGNRSQLWCVHGHVPFLSRDGYVGRREVEELRTVVQAKVEIDEVGRKRRSV